MRGIALAGLLAGLFSLLGVPGEAFAGVGDKYTGSVASEVTTKPTGSDGVRHSAESEWTTFTCPKGHVINKDATKVAEQSAAGSENDIRVEYDDYEEVVPGTGIKQPRTIRVQTFARGPKGFNSGRGWTKAKVEFVYVQVK